MEFIHDLSELKFDGEGESTFCERLFQVIYPCFCNKVSSEDIMARLLTLTFEGHVKQLYHTLLVASIHFLAQLTKMLCKSLIIMTTKMFVK